MTQPNDSFLVDPGLTTPVPFHTIGSLKFAVDMKSGADGTLSDDALGVYASSTMTLWQQINARASRYTIFNGDAALIVEVLLLWIMSSRTDNSPVGFGVNYALFNTTSTAPSGGTANTPVKLDTTTGALDSDIAVRSATNTGALTVTSSGEALSSGILLSSNAGKRKGRKEVWNARRHGNPLILRQNQGLSLEIGVTGGGGGVGDSAFQSGAGVIFRVR